jgi:hypothetical protein
MAVLRIRRSTGQIDRYRAYQIILNDRNVGKVKNDEIVELNISSSRHELYLKIDWCESDAIQFNIAEGDTVEFRTWNDLHGPTLVIGLFYSIFQRGWYMKLERVGD